MPLMNVSIAIENYISEKPFSFFGKQFPLKKVIITWK